MRTGITHQRVAQRVSVTNGYVELIKQVYIVAFDLLLVTGTLYLFARP